MITATSDNASSAFSRRDQHKNLTEKKCIRVDLIPTILGSGIVKIHVSTPLVMSGDDPRSKLETRWTSGYRDLGERR